METEKATTSSPHGAKTGTKIAEPKPIKPKPGQSTPLEYGGRTHTGICGWDGGRGDTRTTLDEF